MSSYTSSYTTIQGDTWDMIAKRVYGSESYMSLLMVANPSLLDFFVFPEGVFMVIPEKPEEVAELPEWRN